MTVLPDTGPFVAFSEKKCLIMFLKIKFKDLNIMFARFNKILLSTSFFSYPSITVDDFLISISLVIDLQSSITFNFESVLFLSPNSMVTTLWRKTPFCVLLTSLN